MTTHNWGESAYGTWSLEIDNDGLDGKEKFLFNIFYVLLQFF